MNKIKIPTYKFALRSDLQDHPMFLPSKAEPLATGWDVRSTVEIKILPFEYVKIPLGFRTFCPEGWWFELKPRSSSFGKKKLHALYGTIDEAYEGELLFAAQYCPESETDSPLIIKVGDAVAQIIPVKRQEMFIESISNEEYEKLVKTRAASRGDGGFGSTG